MQVKTILNRIEKHRSFVYGSVHWVEGRRLELEVEIRARANCEGEVFGMRAQEAGLRYLGATALRARAAVGALRCSSSM